MRRYYVHYLQCKRRGQRALRGWTMLHHHIAPHRIAPHHTTSHLTHVCALVNKRLDEWVSEDRLRFETISAPPPKGAHCSR